jgi:hypothetical protein
MATKRCQFCGRLIYGRADKRYCHSTCRRDACRVRERAIRQGDYEFVRGEHLQSPRAGSVLPTLDRLETALIPMLERRHGPNHRDVHRARSIAQKLREAEEEKLREETLEALYRFDAYIRAEQAAWQERRDARGLT